MTTPQPLQATPEQVQRVIDHVEKQISAYRTMNTGFRELARQRAERLDAQRAKACTTGEILAFDLIGASGVGLILEGAIQWCEVRLRECEENLKMHRMVKQRLESGIVLPHPGAMMERKQ